MELDLGINPQPQLVKKFYFLDYFLILLKSIERYSKPEDIFEAFKNYKHEYQLGESKYKKITVEDEELSEVQLSRYLYTLQQVLIETEGYDLIKKNNNGSYELTNEGRKALEESKNDKHSFNQNIFRLMETKHFAFYHLVNLCYRVNRSKSGLLLFPIYSPLKLGLDKNDLRKTKDIIQYSKLLRIKLQKEIAEINSVDRSLENEEKVLLKELRDSNLIGSNDEDPYSFHQYNSIISRFRKFWLNYILKSIYGYEYSFETFNIWVERGKQLGLIHSTEFFPNVSGRMVYPTSVIATDTKNQRFQQCFIYSNDKRLFIHKPDWTDERVQEDYVKVLADCYFDLKATRKYQKFINLSDLREKVCYRMKIPSFVFDDFLEKSYVLNLKGLLKIQISLEADRLPQETSAMYLKREPVLVNGKYKNIIAIDYKKISQ